MNVQIHQGSTREQRSRRVADVSRSLMETLGERPEHIHVVIQEIADDAWGFAGQLTDDWKRQQG